MVTKRSSSARRRRSPAVSRGTGVLCAAAVAGALLTGCGSDDKDRGASTGAGEEAAAPATSAPASATESGENLTEDQAERKDLVPKAKVGYDKALRTAVAAVPKSMPVSIELKGPPDSPRWDAEVATDDGTEHTVRVDAVTGKAGQTRAKDDQDADDKRQLADWLKKATVTAPQAAKTATDKKKGTVTSIELDDTDQGVPKWSVDVVTSDDWNKTTYDIDATNRKVLREHVDRD
ncbi:PepSY domain-containing protein [Streptomyces alfalfae]|uniref:PepSY domain-containing protein n=1 Tax=Streptomyces alfalfae TaxID=1642299 RepID=A0A7T4PMU8_9ACTN|nr:PepSY domain-containing protein [Streptomyces alfalfae]QQC93202.1 PepSY domain-containing protein [Streptomyces alfalfae]QUI35512.1 PepSY domain-containing protein [Streptomyces alfalfae]